LASVCLAALRKPERLLASAFSSSRAISSMCLQIPPLGPIPGVKQASPSGHEFPVQADYATSSPPCQAPARANDP
jgi:hypothetical protein